MIGIIGGYGNIGIEAADIIKTIRQQTLMENY